MLYEIFRVEPIESELRSKCQSYLPEDFVGTELRACFQHHYLVSFSNVFVERDDYRGGSVGCKEVRSELPGYTESREEHGT